MTRTSDRWQSKPGNFDSLHAGQLFATGNGYGIPDLLPAAVAPPPAWLVPYRQRIRVNEPLDDGAVHCFSTTIASRRSGPGRIKRSRPCAPTPPCSRPTFRSTGSGP
jgi:hypothetical protein